MKLSMITCTVTGTIGEYTVTKETTMKQIDTAQLDINACQAQAAEYHARGFNCAQAVACTLAPAVGLDPQIAFTLCGGFVVETVFTIPGLGRYFVQSITARDYPVIMGTTIFLAAFVILMNLLVDLLYKVVDPRINLGKENG